MRTPTPSRGTSFGPAVVASGIVVALGLCAAGCIERSVARVLPVIEPGLTFTTENNAVDSVDLLLVMDNSGSMRENQSNLVAQLRPLIETLTHPPDADMNGSPDYPAVRDLHVGVVSTDLGTPGATVPGCPNSDVGDDGLLNPIRFGEALRRYPPWVSAPAGFRPDDCNREDQFPSFITFQSGTTDVAQFTHDFHCNAALYVTGCGLEQPLEAAYRAVVWHRADDRPGNMDPNAGFLRESALLAIVVLTDEDDGSTRDCRFAEAGVPCENGIDVFQAGSTRWGSPNLNLRFYMYHAGGAHDPTWPLDRYVDPRNPARGFLGTHPGHPERVLFAAIAGVPLEVPTRYVEERRVTDWDVLLGAPDPMNPDDFNARNGAAAFDDPMGREGPVSMRAANQDPNCPERVVPACRREGSAYDPTRPACSATEQYFAWPSRRIAEVARRFDESPICNGRACRNGLVTSICSSNYARAMQAIVARVRDRITGRCLPRGLQRHVTSEGSIVQCLIRESLPEGSACDPSLGRRRAVDAHGRAVADPADPSRVVCDIAQLPTSVDGELNRSAFGFFDVNDLQNPATRAAVAGMGFYYDIALDPNAPNCRQRISFTRNANPAVGARVQLECI